MNSNYGVQYVQPVPGSAAFPVSGAVTATGLPAALGQTTMSASTPVVIASDQTSSYATVSPAGQASTASTVVVTGSGDLVFTDLRSARAGLELDEGLSGKLYLRDEKGNLAVELDKVEGSRMEIGLPPGRYAAVLVDRDERSQASVLVAAGGRASLAPGDFRVAQHPQPSGNRLHKDRHAALDAARPVTAAALQDQEACRLDPLSDDQYLVTFVHRSTLANSATVRGRVSNERVGYENRRQHFPAIAHKNLQARSTPVRLSHPTSPSVLFYGIADSSRSSPSWKGQFLSRLE